MNINCTLFIQICNFIALYFFFKYFIFQSIYEVLQKRKHQTAFVEQELACKELMLLDQEKDLHHQLFSFQNHVKKDFIFPRVIYPSFSFSIGYERNKAEIDHLTQEVEGIIIKEVPRVR